MHRPQTPWLARAPTPTPVPPEALCCPFGTISLNPQAVLADGLLGVLAGMALGMPVRHMHLAPSVVAGCVHGQVRHRSYCL